MVMFEFFMIQKDVKDIPINLHPFKGVQSLSGFSAFKAEGHRAYFVGYRSKTMHLVENIRSIRFCLPAQLLTKVLVLCFKLYLVQRLFFFEDKHTISYSLLVATFSSMTTIIMEVRTLIYVF